MSCVEVVPDLVDRAVVASDIDLLAMCLSQSNHDIIQSVSDRVRGDNADSPEELVGRQGLEKTNSALEVVTDFLLRVVVDVAVRLESRDAGAVLAPLMLPERLIVACGTSGQLHRIFPGV